MDDTLLEILKESWVEAESKSEYSLLRILNRQIIEYIIYKKLESGKTYGSFEEDIESNYPCNKRVIMLVMRDLENEVGSLKDIYQHLDKKFNEFRSKCINAMVY